MNQQEIFDTVVEHLFTQGYPATYGENSSMCRYRGSNNTKCAIGVLIPDDYYVHEMEGNNFIKLKAKAKVGFFTLPEYLLDNKNEALLYALQKIHDHNWEWGKGALVMKPFTPEYLNDKFTGVADNYGLKYEPRTS